MLKNDKVYFVDYGLLEMASKTRNQNRALVGTPSYCSLSVHNSNVNMYKDDMESMALVLISLALECKLPWADAKSDDEVKTKMEKCDMVTLASNCGLIEIGEVVMICRSLKQDQSPDYDMIRNKLIAMRDRKAVVATKTVKAVTISEKKTAAVAVVAAAAPEKKTSSKNKKVYSLIQQRHKLILIMQFWEKPFSDNRIN
jgi:serine/threonine protein kinase